MKLCREKINLIMAREQLSISDIATKCNRSKQRVCSIFNSVKVMPKTAGIIAKALGVDVTEIIEDER